MAKTPRRITPRRITPDTRKKYTKILKDLFTLAGHLYPDSKEASQCIEQETGAKPHTVRRWRNQYLGRPRNAAFPYQFMMEVEGLIRTMRSLVAPKDITAAVAKGRELRSVPRMTEEPLPSELAPLLFDPPTPTPVANGSSASTEKLVGALLPNLTIPQLVELQGTVAAELTRRCS